MTTKQILGLTLLILGIGVVIISGSVLVALIGFALLLMGKKKQENTESNTGKVLFMIGIFLPLPIYILSDSNYHSFLNIKLLYILCVFLSLAGIKISLKGFFKMRKESKEKTNIGQILLLISTVISTSSYIIFLIHLFWGATYSPSIYLLNIALLSIYIFLVIAGVISWKYLNKHSNMSTMGLSLICIGTVLSYFSVINSFIQELNPFHSLSEYIGFTPSIIICYISSLSGPFIIFYGWYKFIGFNKPKSHN